MGSCTYLCQTRWLPAGDDGAEKGAAADDGGGNEEADDKEEESWSLRDSAAAPTYA